MLMQLKLKISFYDPAVVIHIDGCICNKDLSHIFAAKVKSRCLKTSFCRESIWEKKNQPLSNETLSCKHPDLVKL